MQVFCVGCSPAPTPVNTQGTCSTNRVTCYPSPVSSGCCTVKPKRDGKCTYKISASRLLQVSTLLSKAEEAVERPRVTPEALEALEAEVSSQGNTVAEAKAVRKHAARPNVLCKDVHNVVSNPLNDLTLCMHGDKWRILATRCKAEHGRLCAQKASEDKANKDLQREVSAQLTKLQKLKAELTAQKEAAQLQCAPPPSSSRLFLEFSGATLGFAAHVASVVG